MSPLSRFVSNRGPDSRFWEEMQESVSDTERRGWDQPRERTDSLIDFDLFS